MTDPIDYGRLAAGRDCNYWALDPTLRRAARRAYPDDEFAWAASRLADWGETVGHQVVANAEVVEHHGPELHTYDRDGEVANEVVYHPSQHDNERLAYGAGIVADSFRAPPGREEPLGLTHHLTMNALLSYADPGFACPVAMTGGAAFVLETFREASPRPDLLDPYIEGLTTREYEALVEGAMFLTETQGGSDVGAVETTAEPTDEAGVYELTGEKWFCSNIDAEGTLVLARRPDAPEGTQGLSLFVVPHTTRDGDLNDQRYRRLKDKLGTISVPTGEVELEGATGYLVGEPERGFTYMTEMLNLERLHNAFAAVGVVGRALLEAKVHAADREAFGDTIDQYPLMRRDLAEMTITYEGMTNFVFAAAGALDRRERADPESEARERAFKRMRLLIPVAKYRTAREAIDVVSYACEVLGGNGYVEGFATERLLRDAQVLPIWEGTSNILALDVLRALDREDAHEALVPAVRERLDGTSHPVLADAVAMADDAFRDLQTALGTLATEDRRYAQYEAKEFADLLYDVVTASLLLDAAQTAIEERGDAREALVARRFVHRQFADEPVRGITDGDAPADEHYDALVRYASLDVTALEAAAPADD
jgi:acyl-CoA dehydrogenase